MGIKFRCQGCDKKLHVKAFLAGKRGVCPHCGAKVRIPPANQESEGGGARVGSEHRATEPVEATTAAGSDPASTHASTSSSVEQRSPSPSEPDASHGADPISEAPEAVWYVRPPTGGQYGPADGETARRWLDEGRVSADSLIWREGWSDWKTADSVFPSLCQVFAPTDTPVAAAVPDDAPRDPFAFGDSKPGSRQAKTRLPSNSNVRNVAIVVTLAIACVGLLIALLFVLRN